MRERCYQPSNTGYKRYGVRGIKVCKRWLGPHGYENFLADVGRAPTPKHTLDRVDTDGDYRPSNVRWATRKEQGRNKRTNRMLTAFGKTLCLNAWAEETRIPRLTIYRRLRRGLSTEAALTK